MPNVQSIIDRVVRVGVLAEQAAQNGLIRSGDLEAVRGLLKPAVEDLRQLQEPATPSVNYAAPAGEFVY